MLLFQKRFHAGLLDGSITITFRQWDKPRLKVGGLYRVHPIGVVQIDRIDEVKVADITNRDAVRAGFVDREELLDYLRPAARGKFGPQTTLFKFTLRHAGEADFVPEAAQGKLTADDVAEIDRQLARFDAKRAWTRETLELIASQPRTAASKLAAQVGRETQDFKTDVRKLKKLGLTQSFEVGYSLTPRGKAYWKRAAKR